MNIRPLLPVVLLCSALALSACGNKGPLVAPPPPDDEEWPVEEAEADEDAGFDDADDEALDDDADPAIDDEGVDGEGEDPEDDPVPAAGDDGDGDA